MWLVWKLLLPGVGEPHGTPLLAEKPVEPSPKSTMTVQHGSALETSTESRTGWPAVGAVGSIRTVAVRPSRSADQLLAGAMLGMPVGGGPTGGAPGEAPPLPAFHGVALTACVAVGPGTAGQAGCSPFPSYGPNDLVSPVIDPFCQIRSDCTKASPPRQ